MAKKKAQTEEKIVKTEEVVAENATAETKVEEPKAAEPKKEAPKPKKKASSGDKKPAAKKNPDGQTGAKRKKKEPVVIDEETRDTRALLKGARSRFVIQKGMIERIDVLENAPTRESAVCAVVRYKNFKIIIPAPMMGLEMPKEGDSFEKASILKKHMNTMLGSNIEYVVSKVSETENVAIADRSLAMSIKQKQYFINKYRSTGKSYMEYAMENKIPVEADIVAVSGSQVRLCVCGAEGKVLARDAAWRFSSNLSEYFFPGDTVKVIIKEIGKREDGSFTVRASIKETTPNAQINNISDFSVDSTCLGKVSGAIQSGYFLAIGDNRSGIEAFCDLVHGGVVPMIGDLVSCQLTKIDYETGQAKAKITRIIRRASET